MKSLITTRRSWHVLACNETKITFITNYCNSDTYLEPWNLGCLGGNEQIIQDEVAFEEVGQSYCSPGGGVMSRKSSLGTCSRCQ